MVLPPRWFFRDRDDNYCRRPAACNTHTHTQRKSTNLKLCTAFTLSCLASFILFHKLPSYYQFHRGNFYLLFVLLANDQNRTCSLYIIVLDIFTVLLCVRGDHPKIRHGTRISVPCFVLFLFLDFIAIDRFIGSLHMHT